MYVLVLGVLSSSQALSGIFPNVWAQEQRLYMSFCVVTYQLAACFP